MPHPSIKTTRAFSPTKMYVIDSCVKGHHVSKHFWTPTIGETFVCKREPENPTDAYAVAVMANSIVVGHILYFPRRSFELEAFSFSKLSTFLFAQRSSSSVRNGTFDGTAQLTDYIYIGGFYFGGLLPKPPIRQI